MLLGHLLRLCDGSGVLLGVLERVYEMLGVGVGLGETLGVFEGVCEYDGCRVLIGLSLRDGVIVSFGVNLYHLGLHTFPILIAALYITPIIIFVLDSYTIYYKY